MVDQAKGLAPDESDTFVGMIIDGERMVTLKNLEDISTTESPKELCKRHVFDVLKSFDVELSIDFVNALADTLGGLVGLTPPPYWVDPYLYPLVTTDEDIAVEWLAEI